MGNISNSKCKEKQALQMVGCNNGACSYQQRKIFILEFNTQF